MPGEKDVQSGKLTFFCGKMGAGKSTYAKELADREAAVLVSEDAWLATLYPDQIVSIDDYIQYSGRMRPLVFELVANILGAGTNVVMDFPANTEKQRAWFRKLATAAGAKGTLVHLKVSDDTCLERLSKRRIEQPERAAFDNAAVFNEMSKYFQEPGEDEGLDIQVVENSE